MKVIMQIVPFSCLKYLGSEYIPFKSMNFFFKKKVDIITSFLSCVVGVRNYQTSCALVPIN